MAAFFTCGSKVGVARAAHVLANALGPSAAAEVVAVVAIQRRKHTQLQPDILVHPSRYAPTAHWRDIRDWWPAAEVLSPSSRLYDREVKCGAYLALGVEEYWVVDPSDCSVEGWSRAHNESRRASEVLVWQPTALGREVAIDLRQVLRGACKASSKTTRDEADLGAPPKSLRLARRSRGRPRQLGTALRKSA